MTEAADGREAPEETIDCIDCGGRCHLLDRWALEDPPPPGGVVRYRCEDCLDVWHLVVPGEDED
jgi:hypothetical protein